VSDRRRLLFGSRRKRGFDNNAGAGAGAGAGGAGIGAGTPIDETPLETHLRQALSSAAPRGLATIGVRERIVESIHRRRQRRLQVAGSLAACCLVIAGVTAGAVALHHGGGSNSNTSAAPFVGAPSGTSDQHPTAVRSPASAGSPTSDSVAGAGSCAMVTIAGGSVSGCYGTFAVQSGSGQVAYSAAKSATNGSVTTSESKGPSGSTTATNPDATSSTPEGTAALDKKAVTGPGKPPTSAGANAPSLQSGGEQIVVRLGQMVTVTLPGIHGEIWTAPTVAPGQGVDASRVRTTDVRVMRPGEGSSATFESSIPVTVEINASAINVCGDANTPCGEPTTTWFVILEFQAG